MSRKKSVSIPDSNEYPDTVVLVIATHGIIKIDHKYDAYYNMDDIPKYTIPNGITVYKASAVPPGTCNFVESETTNNFIQFVNSKRLDSITDDSALLDEMQKTIKSYQGSQSEFSVDIGKDIATQRKAGQYEDIDEEVVDFLHSYDKGSISSIYLPMQSMLNKTYLRENPETHELYDWQIVCVNVRGQPDLLPFIQGYKSHYSSSHLIDMSQIIEYLKEKGVTRIIIFDLACSSYRSVQKDEDTGEYIIDKDTGNPDLVDSGITDASIRIIRRNLLKNGFHGGRKKRHTKKSIRKSIRKSTRKSQRSNQKTYKIKQYNK